MIVDCHTHIWQSPEQLGELDLGDVTRPVPGGARSSVGGKSAWRSAPAADPDHHWSQTSVVDHSIVLAVKCRFLKAEIPNKYVADYVNRYPQKLIGFAGIDPTEPSAINDLYNARNNLKLRGITISPANQDFHPCDTRA